jgi:hypothetical protein
MAKETGTESVEGSLREYSRGEDIHLKPIEYVAVVEDDENTAGPTGRKSG